MKTKTAQPQTKTIFRALSDRTRLRILNLLQGGELCVCQIVAVLDVPQPKTSRHLSYFAQGGAGGCQERRVVDALPLVAGT